MRCAAAMSPDRRWCWNRPSNMQKEGNGCETECKDISYAGVHKEYICYVEDGGCRIATRMEGWGFVSEVLECHTR